MTTERDELAAIIDDRWHGYGYNPQGAADAILAKGYRKPYTVTTAAELDALPIGSVVRSSNGTVYERDHVKTNPGDTTWWMETGSSRDYQSSSISLPATVIYEGGRE